MGEGGGGGLEGGTCMQDGCLADDTFSAEEKISILEHKEWTVTNFLLCASGFCIQLKEHRHKLMVSCGTVEWPELVVFATTTSSVNQAKTTVRSVEVLLLLAREKRRQNGERCVCC